MGIGHNILVRSLTKFSPSLSVLVFYYLLCIADMAGLAPQGSQFDVGQYDAKMNELYFIFTFS